MLGYEFTIDTGAHTPYYCKKLSYGSNEGKIIMSHVQKLKDMRWIWECNTGARCSSSRQSPTKNTFQTSKTLFGKYASPIGDITK